MPQSVDNNSLDNKINSDSSELISQISHDLRTPLTSITLALELLERETAGEMNEKYKKYLTSIKESLNDMAGLIEGLKVLK